MPIKSRNHRKKHNSRKHNISRKYKKIMAGGRVEYKKFDHIKKAFTRFKLKNNSVWYLTASNKMVYTLNKKEISTYTELKKMIQDKLVDLEYDEKEVKEIPKDVTISYEADVSFREDTYKPESIHEYAERMNRVYSESRHN
jgi:hypothetical protein